jgi:hypothetical protein
MDLKNPIKLDVGGTKGKSITIAPERSALVIIDMQSGCLGIQWLSPYPTSHLTACFFADYFLHPNLTTSSLGRDAVPATMTMIDAFRKHGMKILWTNVRYSSSNVVEGPPLTEFPAALLSGGWTRKTSLICPLLSSTVSATTGYRSVSWSNSCRGNRLNLVLRYPWRSEYYVRPRDGISGWC